ncbi:hypothetical protein DH2020_046965 [Rehmannia glutinosa]|uniref:RING-type E3 ubiquitin transferase n=1 Tax=Rehmannia glutinosa TaxID=99300 RepID=A0ABR0UAH8_REHGL
MDSVGNQNQNQNQNPWAPYNNYRDCSLGICSIYCPQFCYLIFPPPPPSDDGTPFSPLIIAIIGVLASAFLLVSYYTVVTKYCKRRNNDHNFETEENRDELSQDQWQNINTNGLDESMIKNITVCKYKKGDGLIEGTECAVCLSEFQENESLRLLPKCSHAFHLPCIDMWLKNNSNCPLCRANVVALAHTSSALGMNTCEIRRPEDLVLVVDDPQRHFNEQIVVISGDEDREGVGEFRRSVSPQRQVLISDVLKFEEIDEYIQTETDQLWRGIGCSKGDGGVEESKSSGNRGKDGKLLLRSPVAMKRSVSTGRFMSKVNDKANNFMLPN